jgi:outer membrane protein TolC
MRRNVPSSRLLFATLAALGLGSPCSTAQEKIPTAPAKAVPAPAAAVAATPLTLDDCIILAYQKQPALAAARASLAAAQSGQAALDNLPVYARCLTRELPLRKQQACLGVQSAQAALWQAEWEARYAVTRNYFSVMYVRLQESLLNDLLAKLEKGRKDAKKVIDAGVVGKVTTIDLDLFDVNIEHFKVKLVEARVGADKALSAVREAIGVGCDYPLDLVTIPLPDPLPGLDRDDLVRLAVANRGEIVQASSASQVTELEIAAQAKKWHSLKVGTFAGGSDIHATPIPVGVSNGEYRPGAIGIEYPPMLVGRRDDRVARATDLSQRAAAVVDKTHNLVTLETDNSYLKWLEAKGKLDQLRPLRPRVLDVAEKINKRLTEGNATGSEYIQTVGLADQVQAEYNEALYMHALALAALERITAGGFRVYPHR